MSVPEPRVTVYEWGNNTLKEFFLTVAPAADPPPSPISHWKAEHEIQTRVVEANLELGKARAFVNEYQRTCRRIGWRVIVDPLLD